MKCVTRSDIFLFSLSPARFAFAKLRLGSPTKKEQYHILATSCISSFKDNTYTVCQNLKILRKH